MGYKAFSFFFHSVTCPSPPVKETFLNTNVVCIVIQSYALHLWFQGLILVLWFTYSNYNANIKSKVKLKT